MASQSGNCRFAETAMQIRQKPQAVVRQPASFGLEQAISNASGVNE
jgi:hypothetical protein